MRSRTNRDFRRRLRAQPAAVRQQAGVAYRAFQLNPFHSSLSFKAVAAWPGVYSARVGLKHRVLGRREEDDEIVWFWIGTHAEYDELLRRR